MPQEPEAGALTSNANSASTAHQYSGIVLGPNAVAHFGDVNYNVQGEHLRASKKLQPTCVIPFRRDRDFVGRSVLDEIWQCARQPAARVGIVGLGGVGKTQLAIEYAYRRRDADPNLWVFWVHASSTTRFEESYRAIAQQIQLAGWDDPTMDVLAMVHAWLSDETNGQWTMVVDNADNTEVLYSPRPQDNTPAMNSTSSANTPSLSRYLPSSPNGSILITSRSHEVVDGLIEYAEDILHVETMTVEEGAALLTKKLRPENRTADQDNLLHLVRELDCMPLAITQAAAYINQRSPRSTISRYLDDLRKGNAERTALLEQQIRDPRRDGHASNSITITWHISFEHMRQTRDSAARLLALMSLFDREAIPGHLLANRYSVCNKDASDDETRKSQLTDSFEDDVATLRAYSLIRIGSVENLFDMHRLVQFSTRRWLELHGELAEWQVRYASLLRDAFPNGEYENWSTCQALFPHVELLMSYHVDNTVFRRSRLDVAHYAAWYMDMTGKYTRAETMARSAITESVQLYGDDNDQSLHIMALLAVVLEDQGKHAQAEELNKTVLARLQEQHGMTHKGTLTTMDNLATTLRSQAKYAQAEELHRQALAGKEKTLGGDHPDTLTSMHNLASVLRDQGNYIHAEELYRQVLAVQKEKLGADHPTTLIVMNNLALVLQGQGNYIHAEELYRQVFAVEKEKLGMDHPSTLTTMSNLAVVLKDQGKHVEAEELLRRALAGTEKELGTDHPETLRIVYSLAHVLADQGNLQEALLLCNRAVDGLRQSIGSSHPNTQTCIRWRDIWARKIDDRQCPHEGGASNQ